MDREDLTQLPREFAQGWRFKSEDLRHIDHFDHEPDFAFSRPIRYSRKLEDRSRVFACFPVCPETCEGTGQEDAETQAEDIKAFWSI